MNPFTHTSKLKSFVLGSFLMATTTLSAQTSWESIDQTTLNTLSAQGEVSVASAPTGDLYLMAKTGPAGTTAPTLYRLVDGTWQAQNSAALASIEFSSSVKFSISGNNTPIVNDGNTIARFNGTDWDIVWTRTWENDVNGTITTDKNGTPYTVFLSEGAQSIEVKRFADNWWQPVGNVIIDMHPTGYISSYQLNIAFDNSNTPFVSYLQRSGNTPNYTSLAIIKKLEDNTWEFYASMSRSHGYLRGLEDLFFTTEGTLYATTGISYITTSQDLYKYDTSLGEWVATGAGWSQTRGSGTRDWPAQVSTDGSVIYWAHQSYPSSNMASMQYSTGDGFSWINGTTWEESEFTDNKQYFTASLAINKYNNPVVAYITKDDIIEVKKFALNEEIDPEPQFDPSAHYAIVNKLSSKCLDVAENATWNGANIHQWDCYNGLNQMWTISETVDGYSIINAHSSKALDIANFSLENGGNVHQWDFVNGANQQWNISFYADSYAIKNVLSQKALDVAEWATWNWGNIHQWDFIGADNQLWDIVKID